jgi:hypothetical protein
MERVSVAANDATVAETVQTTPMSSTVVSVCDNDDDNLNWYYLSIIMLLIISSVVLVSVCSYDNDINHIKIQCVLLPCSSRCKERINVMLQSVAGMSPLYVWIEIVVTIGAIVIIHWCKNSHRHWHHLHSCHLSVITIIITIQAF